uniref:Uncharacterized protein n=1 Tax=Klebsiella pneumoniae TaxID=573 RepID=A0A8B0SXJ2_KLEPN|nr:hypothetical protein [Klebsiella pneumoniae]
MGFFPVMGLGDSLSDHRFMKLCSWFGLPRQSQFAEAISQRIFLESNKMSHFCPVFLVPINLTMFTFC